MNMYIGEINLQGSLLLIKHKNQLAKPTSNQI